MGLHCNMCCAQVWQGRWVAQVAGCQNLATPAGLWVATKRTGLLFEAIISLIVFFSQTQT